MASYVLSGYTTPTGVSSASAVKDMQKQLGVTADGVWGPNTQAAYDAAQQKTSATSSATSSSTYNAYSSASAESIFDKSTDRYAAPNGRTGTSFTATGAAIADTPNPNYEDSTGIFDAAMGRTPGYIEHVSGYTGQGYRDAKGNYYTEYGALLRDTGGFFYPEGAAVSENGMYFDNGSGWQYAGHAVAKGANGVGYVPSTNLGYGMAPGAVVFSIDNADLAQRKADAAAATAAAAANVTGAADKTPNVIENELGVKKTTSPEWESYFDRELEEYRRKLLEGYGIV